MLTQASGPLCALSRVGDIHKQVGAADPQRSPSLMRREPGLGKLPLEKGN